MENKELKVGETFEHMGVKLKVVKNTKCDKCYFLKVDLCCDKPCMSQHREDNLNVIFKEVK